MQKNLINIKNDKGVLTVGSLEVAEHFEKQHKDVLRSIENLVAQNCATKNMFIESSYENRGKRYPQYLITRDGFSLLVMGFTGKKALGWKLKYIEAFNKMEKSLKSVVSTIEAVKSPPKAKIYDGQEVFTLRDCEYVWEMDHAVLCGYLKEKNFIPNNDYYILTGEELNKFKSNNSDISKFTSSITIITQKGLKKLINKVKDEDIYDVPSARKIIDKLRLSIKMLSNMLDIIYDARLTDDYREMALSIFYLCLGIGADGSDLKRELSPSASQTYRSNLKTA